MFEAGQQLVDEMADAGDYSGEITTELVYGRPVSVIPRFVEDNGIDEVVIGSRGRDGTARLLLGSVAETVVRRTPVPVTVVRQKGNVSDARLTAPERVLVPFDQSVCSRHALEYALHAFPDATVTALFVSYPRSEPYEHIEAENDLENVIAESKDVERETSDVFETARGIAERNDRTVETAVDAGEPSRQILEWIVENDVDHVVLGCHGRDGVARWLLGVVRRSPITVTAVK